MSYSRSDVGVTGDPVTFNATIWNAYMSTFATPAISLQQMAQARSARIAVAKTQNPAIDFNPTTQMTNLAETAFMSIIFSNGGVDGGVSAAQMDALFRQERLPVAQGFARPVGRMFPETVTLVGQKISNATAPTIARRSRRR